MKLPVDSISDPDDSLLVQAVQAGDLHCFKPLLDRHMEAIHAFVSLKLPIGHLVDEITHETFVFAFHHLNQFEAGTSLRAWLRAIAAQKVRAEVERYCREERNRLAYSEQRALDVALAESSAPDGRAVEALTQCLAQLPESVRILLNLKYHDESTSEEIAKRLERSLAWVRTTLCRVRQQLRDCVQKRLKAT
ncbi:MAG: RNA polymerase sigma factor [Verrucomicrobiia bacterium]